MKDRLLRGVVRAALGDPLVRVITLMRRHDLAAGLDPQVAAILEIERIGRLPRLETMDPPSARSYSNSGFAPLELPPTPMREVIDTSAGGCPVRIFVPEGAGTSWIVYFHGGGGVIGSVASSEPVTRFIAAETGCTVASVDYRLGPEHKHPAAIEDACAAFASLVSRVRGKVAVAGDSFGGYLSTQVDHLVRGRKPDLQVLIYPMVDQTMSSGSIDRLADGYLLTKPMMQWFRDGYTNPSDDRRAISPLFWPDLHGAARTIIATAGFDPLCDEGERYAERLREAGVDVCHLRFPSLVHGFISLAGAVTTARRALEAISSEIRATIAT